MRPLPNTPLLSSTQVKRGLRKGDQYYWVSVHENPRGSQEVNTIIMGDRNNINFFQEFLNVFPEELFKLPPGRKVDHAIELTLGVAPISHGPYLHSLLEINEPKAQIKDLLEKGYIQLSKSLWGVPMLFKKKKDGVVKMCVDYCWLNKLNIRIYLRCLISMIYLITCVDHKYFQKQIYLMGIIKSKSNKWIFIR